MPSYLHIAEKRSKETFTEAQRQWQLVRRGRCKSRHTRYAATHTATHTLQHTHCNTHTAAQTLQHTRCNTHTATHTLQHTHCNTHTVTHTLQHTHCNTHHITRHHFTASRHTLFTYIYMYMYTSNVVFTQAQCGSNSRGVADVSHVTHITSNIIPTL